MSAHDDLDAMVGRLTSAHTKARNRLIRLYALGVKAKLRQAEYAFQRLEELVPQAEPVPPADFAVAERVEFYVDSFFAFLYSSLDVLGQVINQAHKLGLDERKVSFNTVETKLKTAAAGTPLQTRLSKLSGSHLIGNADNYRNCSTHRRQIYIQVKKTEFTGTAAYDATGPVVTVTRILADNPLDHHPRVDQQREILAYCKRVLKYVQDAVSELSELI
jgi:Cthe_2314-like HEPN